MKGLIDAMAKNNIKRKQKTFEDANNTQQKLANSENSRKSGINLPHNARKEGLGPNTER